MLFQIDEIGIGILRIRIQLMLAKILKINSRRAGPSELLADRRRRPGWPLMGLELLDTASDDKPFVGGRNDERLV